MGEVKIKLSDYDQEFKKMLRYKIAYTSREVTNINEDKDFLYLNTIFGSEERVKSKVKLLIRDLEDNYRKIVPEVIFENNPEIKFTKDDIYNELIERKWIIPYGNGLVGFGKDFLLLFKFLDNIFVNWSKRYHAEEYIYPELISIDTLNQYNYISQFPNHIMFSTHLVENLDVINDFSKRVLKGSECYNDSYMDKPKYINNTAVCPHVYKQFENKVIDLEKPVVITAAGKCKRYESINMTKLERLLDFTMREIVVIGSSDYVLKTREEFIEMSKQLIKQLGLKANIKTGNDPFFTSEYAPKVFLQNKFKLKYELNAFLPYNNKELSVGSFNYHGTFFSDAFNIKSLDGREVYTGCIAFGIERFVYAILCQLGTDKIKSILNSHNIKK